ncbi:MAG: ankyrin repeat domain-containing protein [Legionella sp.]|jgi:ankyrin repeat protein
MNNPKFYVAIENGDIEKVVAFVNQGKVDLNENDKKGTPPIVYAVKSESLELLAFLITSGANTNVCDQNQETPLGIAATRGLLEATNLLIQAKANINQLTVDGHSALMLAARHNQHQIVQLLLLEGANPFLSNKAHKTALQIADATQYTESATVLRYFTSNINIQNIKGLSPLAYAVYVGDADYVLSLLKHGADLSYINPLTGEGPLVTAIKVGTAHMIELLVTLSPSSASPHPQHYQALSAAMQKNALKLFRFLSENLYLDTNSNDFRQLLIDAVDKDKLDMLNILLSKITNSKQREQMRLASMARAAYTGKLMCTARLFKSSDVHLNLKDTFGNNLFHNAVIRNQHCIVQFLAQYFHVDCFNQHRLTSLQLAVEGGQVDMIRTLASLKADLNAHCYKHKKTPLMLAFTSGQLEAAKTLITLGVDLSKRNVAGETVLHILAYCTSISHSDISFFVALFKTQGLDLNSPNFNYDTPLMLAVDLSNLALAEVLVKSGVDVNAVNLQGQTALDLARENNDARMMALVTPKPKPPMGFFNQVSISCVAEECLSGAPTL